ncbi:M20 metallopeptidase family protein [Synechococcus elongatus]|nr:amidohydrolase [Synechococcus elongatus]MBD2588120.1 amidohydrolase [Synechococcus elongatus FACHB-242]MBD2689188.1 amidohydrolase [Synechococcus elongatus FACHB-1061]MBD2707172.1 amidohydrolase [Synechococcus elongatus PCC 7942 = FACHB-805]UOW70039.1 amidohydrolase [Synechococcus elongatus PCC 7943]UOW72760.1 amidohydrolase [Synechococcus elongatus PCC 6311]
MLLLSQELPETVRPAVRDRHAQIVAWRQQLHRRPELGFQEQETAAFIAARLTELGVSFQAGVAGTGIVAEIAGQRSGPTLAIRADMDALPILEANEIPYRSEIDGRMHACGHDGHVAIALGTAACLQANSDFAGRVKIIFQPAEEGPGGAAPMIAEGVLENPAVDAIIGLHLWNYLPLGKVGVRSGPLMAAVELFDLTIQGRGGHAAIPQNCIDAVLVASQIVTLLQSIVSRNVDPLHSAVVTIGSLHAGTTYNVIADRAQLKGTVRYFDDRYQGFLQERIEQIVAGVCNSHGATYELNYRKLYPAVINDSAIADLVRSVAEEVLEPPLGVVPDCQTMGAEDMSYFLQKVPGCYFFLGSANLDRGLNFPHHHPRFNFDETALALGVELFLRCVERFCR